MNNRGFSIVIAIICLVFFSALGVTGLSLLKTETSMATDMMQSIRVFFIAEGGLNYYIEKLKEQNASWIDPPTKPAGKSLGGGTFTITTVNEEADEIDVICEAHLPELHGEVIVRAVRAHVPRSAFSGSGAAHAALLYGMHSFGNHTKFMNVNNGYVEGDVGASMSVQGEEEVRIDGEVIYPSNVEPPPDDFETMMQRYEDIADNVIDGNFTFEEGTYGTPGAEELWYVKGNVGIDGNVTIHGSIVSEGGINFENNSRDILVDAADGKPALIASTVVGAQKISNLTIKGLIWADNNVHFQNDTNTTIIGVVLSGNNIQFQGSEDLNIIYDPDVARFPPIGFGSDYDPIVWRETYKGGY